MKIILFSLLFTILCLSLVSSQDTNSNYDVKQKTLEIKKGDDPSINLTLLTPLNVNVIRGSNRKIAEVKIDIFDNTDLKELKEKSIDFYDLKEIKKISKKFKIKYKKEVSGYENISYIECQKDKDDINKENCRKVITDKLILKSGYVWEDYSDKIDYQDKSIILGIFIDVLPGEFGEWIPKDWFGYNIPQWASWNDTFEDGLLMYYDFTEPTDSSLIIDTVDKIYNGTIFANGDHITGKRGDSLRLDGTSGTYADVDSVNGISGLNNFTVSFWINVTGGAGVLRRIVNKATGLASTSEWLVLKTASDEIYFELYNSTGAVSYTGPVLSLNTTWYHVVIGQNDTNGYFCVNGSCTSVSKRSISATATKIRMGRNYADDSENYIGLIDEFALWNRSLDQAEISALYDSSNGTFRNPDQTLYISTSCGALDETMKFYVRDELNLSLLTADVDYIINYDYGGNQYSDYGTLTANTFYLCADLSTPGNYTLNYLELFYNEDTHVPRRYYIFSDVILSSTLVETNLYDLTSSDSTSVIISLSDSSANILQDYYIKLRKKYLTMNNYLTVEVTRTDENGLTILHLIEEDPLYIYEFYNSSGTFVYATSESKAICQETICKISFIIPIGAFEDSFYSVVEDNNFNYYINITTGNIVQFIYTSLNSSIYNVTFSLYGLSIINDSSLLFNQTDLNSDHGSLSFNVTSQPYNTFLVYVYFNDDYQTSKTLSKYDNSWELFSMDGLVFSILITIALCSLAMFDWRLSIIASVVSLVLSMWLKFIAGSVSSCVSIIIVGVFLIIQQEK